MVVLDAQSVLCVAVVTSLAVMTVPSIVALLECRCAPAADEPNLPPDEAISFTIVISAYLPNEQGIVLDTLRYFSPLLTSGEASTLILAYNTPVELPVEHELHTLARALPGCRILHVKASRSKATNLNAAMTHVTTSAVAFFDCDSRPDFAGLRRARAWLAQGYDAVQGSNLPRVSAGWFERLIHTECLIKYHVSYLARFLAAGVVYFTGSNGYWRTSVVRATMFRDRQQVEDIDISIRALLGGARFVYDPAITAIDEPPPTMRAWWTQRVRWAQGWAQLFRNHQRAILTSPVLRGRRRAIWTYFLLFRRLIMPIALSSLVLAIIAQAGFGIPPMRAEALAALLLYLTGLLAATASLAVLRHRHAHAPPECRLGSYPLLFPLYDLIRELTILRGTVALFAHPRTWRVTPRAICNPVQRERPW